METEPNHALVILALLEAYYGPYPWHQRREPMRELVSTMLSHRTNGANEERAFEQLWKHFGSWESIAAGDVAAITEAIAPANYPESKAPRIKAAVAQIIAERGAPTIDFLAALPPAEAIAWLTRLPGVGVKTATLVLLFCFRVPVLPVDTHVHRISQRVGLIGPKVSAEKAHDLLLEMLPPDPDTIWDFHHQLLRHGQRICTFSSPRCPACPILQQCAYGRSHVAAST